MIVRADCITRTHEIGYSQSPTMQEASVSRYQKIIFDFRQGSASPSAYRFISLKVTLFNQSIGFAESRRQATRIIRIIVVPVAVGIDNKEIVRVVVIRRTQSII